MPPQVIDAAFGEAELSSELLNLPISLRTTKFGQWILSVEGGMEHELHLNSSIRTILDTLGVFLECSPPHAGACACHLTSRQSRPPAMHYANINTLK